MSSLLNPTQPKRERPKAPKQEGSSLFQFSTAAGEIKEIDGESHEFGLEIVPLGDTVPTKTVFRTADKKCFIIGIDPDDEGQLDDIYDRIKDKAKMWSQPGQSLERAVPVALPEELKQASLAGMDVLYPSLVDGNQNVRTNTYKLKAFKQNSIRAHFRKIKQAAEAQIQAYAESPIDHMPDHMPEQMFNRELLKYGKPVSIPAGLHNALVYGQSDLLHSLGEQKRLELVSVEIGIKRLAAEVHLFFSFFLFFPSSFTRKNNID